MGISDPKIDTTLKITCQAAQGGLISGKNESCAVTGNGALSTRPMGRSCSARNMPGGLV